MPVRLTVVIVQSPPTPDLQSSVNSGASNGDSQRDGGQASGIAGCSVDEVLGELLGLPEIDLTLVNRLESVSIASTDHLTLQSITGDVVVLDWQTASQTCQSLQAIGVDAVRWPHPDDPDAVGDPTQRSRRVYAFDLRRFAEAKKLRESILRLHASKQVKTFSLSLGAPSAARPQSPVSSQPQTAPSLPPSTQPIRPKPEGDANNEPSDNANSQTPPLDRSLRRSVTSEQLDSLVDQLDDFDP
ncbi:hypothetical protein [Novipirellula caenicola]|uniref:Uncharacterized protein n=1 Tax=Novipirellula caenicola TaxID=1536901 RepID=A0ABP9VXP6_9BACT